MDLLNEMTVNTDVPPLALFGNEEEANVEEEDGDVVEEEVTGEDEEGDVVEEEVIEVDATGKVKPKKKRTSNYIEIEDITLCRSWAQVGMDAAAGMDQTRKRYWQRIEVFQSHASSTPAGVSHFPIPLRPLGGDQIVL
jgi:hypothetical protein